MPQHRRRYAPEFREEAVKMVIELSRPVADVAKELGMNEGTLGSWVNRYRKDHPEEDTPLTVAERSRLRELERENRELRAKTQFLGKPRPSSPGSIGELQVRVHRCREGELDHQDVRLDRCVPVWVL